MSVATLDRIERYALLVAALGTALAADVEASPSHASLVVTRGEGAEDCPDAVTLRARVASIAGADAVAATPDASRRTWLQVEFVRVLSGYRATISASGARKGTRSIDDVGPSCSNVADAVAIAVVMLTDPAVDPPKPESVPAPVLQPRPILPAAADRPVVTRPPPATAELELGLGASGGAAIAVIEHAVPLVEGGAHVRLGELVMFGAGAGYVFEDRAAEATGSVDLDLVYAYGRACVRAHESPHNRLAVCVDPMFGSLRGSGDDYATISSRRLPWLAAAASAELHSLLSASLLWSARVRVLVPLIRQGFSVVVGDERASAFSVPPIGGMLLLGVAVEP